MITKITQISTKKGDLGMTSNAVMEILPKDDILFQTLGSIDELSSFLGLTYHFIQIEELLFIQNHLEIISAIIASNPNHNNYTKLKQITQEDVLFLEIESQKELTKHPLEPKFCLPGSSTSLAGSYLDVSRSVCRRAERELTHFAIKKIRKDLNYVQMYLNRLSDFLYILARNQSKIEPK
ncbi:MAG: ATP:cob(I)alamin adenosyltransferase [Firmicutes bacterium]|nr:ATP:cob(I)alamin adenosyltransferase [Bacillota bacterium]